MRHEEAAAFAAGAESQLTGEIAVCAGSCGPGNLHLINGLYDCHRSRVPVLAIAAQMPSQEIGSGYFQETHPEHLFKDCSHYCEAGLASGADAARAGDRHAHGHRHARRRSGCHPRRRCCSGRVLTRRWRWGSDHSASVVCPSIEGARPGSGAISTGRRRSPSWAVLGARARMTQLMALAAKLKAPIVHAMRGKEFIEYDNPVRRRHDRPAGLFLRLPRHDELRRAADAGHRFSLPAVLSQRCEDYSSRHARGADWAPDSGRPGPDRQASRTPSTSCCRC